MRATVLVRPKQGILDPQGEAGGGAGGPRGCPGTTARGGAVIDLDVDAPDEAAARTEVEKMCEQLLANQLIESYDVEIHA
jgi:phosphoribosylformylglycinamidine synthase